LVCRSAVHVHAKRDPAVVPHHDPTSAAVAACSSLDSCYDGPVQPRVEIFCVKMSSLLIRSISASLI
jgi:hypothetical protein